MSLIVDRASKSNLFKIESTLLARNVILRCVINANWVTMQMSVHGNFYLLSFNNGFKHANNNTNINAKNVLQSWLSSMDLQVWGAVSVTIFNVVFVGTIVIVSIMLFGWGLSVILRVHFLTERIDRSINNNSKFYLTKCQKWWVLLS